MCCIEAGVNANIPCYRFGCDATLADLQALIAHLHIHNIDDNNA